MNALTLSAVTVRPAARVHGRIVLPGDKSIAHRYAMLGALAVGRTRIEGFAAAADCASTLACLRHLGVPISATDGLGGSGGRTVIEIDGRGPRGLMPPPGPLDAGNSGTTVRLMAGILAAHPFESCLTGDDSLRRRPMGRVVEPLERMGARLVATSGSLPLTISGADLVAIDYTPRVASAQVKSCVLLAGLQARGTTVVREPMPTRDHTERAFETFGISLERSGPDGTVVQVDGGQQPRAAHVTVPGDVSSAAFWAVAAAALPGSDIELVDVGLNPTRAAILDVLTRAGARVDRETLETSGGEPRGTVRVRAGTLRPVVIEPHEVPGLIDELPVLAALGTHAVEVSVSGAQELRAKESDRIAALVQGLARLGADVDERHDGFTVRPTRRLGGGTVDAFGDHRLAMSFAIAALGATDQVTITGAEVAQISYPGFFETLSAICE